MKPTRTHLVIAATAVLFVMSLYSVTPSMATLVFDDGGTHTINYATPEDVVVSNGSTLDIKAPAQISGQVSFGLPAGGSTVSMSGGTITNGIRSSFTPDVNVNLSGTAVVMGGVETKTGIINISDHAVVLGGITNYSGGSAPETVIAGGLVEGGVRQGLGGLSVSGGELRGAVGTDKGGAALSIFDDVNTSVSGGKLIGGLGGVTGGAALYEMGSSPAPFTITGGAFVGGTGGSYGGSAIIAWGAGLSDSIRGGSFDAGHGGLLDGYLLEAFGNNPDLSSPYELEIRGGLFGQETIGRGFYLQDTILTIFGQTDLKFDGARLSGTLLDGNFLSVPVVLGEDAHIVLAPVPEPSTLLLLGSGLAGLGGMAWRRHRRT